MSSQLMTVKEARKLLGKDAGSLSDEQVERLVNDLEEIARLFFKGVREGTIKIPPKTKSKRGYN